MASTSRVNGLFRRPEDDLVDVAKAVRDSVWRNVKEKLPAFALDVVAPEMEATRKALREELATYIIERLEQDVARLTGSHEGKLLEMFTPRIKEHEYATTAAFRKELEGETERLARMYEMRIAAMQEVFTSQIAEVKTEHLRALENVRADAERQLVDVRVVYDKSLAEVRAANEQMLGRFVDAIKSMPVPQVTIPENAIRFEINQVPAQVTNQVIIPDKAIIVQQLPSQVVLPEGAIVVENRLLPSPTVSDKRIVYDEYNRPVQIHEETKPVVENVAPVPDVGA